MGGIRRREWINNDGYAAFCATPMKLKRLLGKRETMLEIEGQWKYAFARWSDNLPEEKIIIYRKITRVRISNHAHARYWFTLFLSWCLLVQVSGLAWTHYSIQSLPTLSQFRQYISVSAVGPFIRPSQFQSTHRSKITKISVSRYLISFCICLR